MWVKATQLKTERLLQTDCTESSTTPVNAHSSGSSDGRGKHTSSRSSTDGQRSSARGGDDILEERRMQFRRYSDSCLRDRVREAGSCGRRPVANTAAAAESAEACAAFVENIALSFVIFGLFDGNLKVLCHRQPSIGLQGLPSGLLHRNNDLQQSAEKYLKSFTATDQVFHQQLQFLDDRKTAAGALRLVYYALLTPEQCERPLELRQWQPEWLSVNDAAMTEADTASTVHFSLMSLRKKVTSEPIIFHLLPDKFTLSGLQHAYEAILGVQFRKSNFRRKISNMEFLVRCRERQKDVAHRAAELYSFDAEKFEEARDSGFVFSI